MKLRKIEYSGWKLQYFVDNNFLWQGEYRDWYPNGEPWEIRHYKNDERYGISISYKVKEQLIIKY